MTPTQLAKDHCANFVDGLCLAEATCKLSDGQLCSYFKKCVLPLATQMPRYNAVLSQYAKLEAKAYNLEESLEAVGRVHGGTQTPCGKCLNCINHNPQLCLSTLRVDKAAHTGVLVSCYCKTCKAPIYGRYSASCSEKCKKSRERLLRYRRLSNSLHKEPVNIEPK